ncbi:MAG: hypothetical protein QXH15_02285, partial [Nitrososphaerota archaeon]
RKWVEDGGIDRFNYLVADGVKGFVNIARNIQTGSSNINVSGLMIGITILLLILLAIFWGLM